MRKLIPLLIALPLVLANPAAGQDLLGPLEDLVDQITRPAPSPQRPQNGAPKPAEVAPIPRPRPPDLPDGRVVEKPATPMVTPAVEAEDVPEAEAVEPEAQPELEVVEDAEPERVYQVACPAVLQGLVEAEIAPPLSEGICGEQSPLVVTAVLSRGRMVPLSSAVTTNCQMASALPGWIADVDGYAEAMLGSRVAEVTAGTSYMCRNRNNASDGFTSEHGFANAVDVVGFTLEDGQSIAVEADWLPAAAPEGRLLRLAHDAACGGFSTVLGPEANEEHRDHLHLDLGCHGASCTARICE